MNMDELFDRVNALKLSDVVNRVVQLKKRGSEWEGLCPFHSDRTLGSFKVNDQKNIWCCFACGVGGKGAVSFYKELYQTKGRLEAATILAQDIGILTKDEADLMCESWQQRTPAIRPNRTSFQKKRNTEREMADAQKLDSIYRLFIECSPELTTSQKRHLREERKLDGYTGFFSFPLPTEKFWASFQEKLVESDLDRRLLACVPGFYYDPKLKRMTFAEYHNAIGIVSHDICGRINGIQIRRDTTEKKNRYVWFSSGFACDENELGYRLGTVNSQVVDVVPPKADTRVLRTIAVTEGKFKAIKLAEMGMWTVNISGVSGWKKAVTSIKDIEKVAGFSEPNIMLFFDADVKTNDSVAKAAKCLAETLSMDQYHIYFAYWPIEKGKGIDDLLNNGSKKELRKMEAEQFIHNYLDPLIQKAEADRKKKLLNNRNYFIENKTN